MNIKLALFAFFILLVSCNDKPESGPATIYYGEDICERCKMIISEKDFGAQYQLSNGKTVKFDDLGCMIHYMKEEKETISNIYIIDHSSKEWIDGMEANYVWSESIPTPMGYGILGFKSRDQAEEHIKKENTKYLGDIKDTTNWVSGNNASNQ